MAKILIVDDSVYMRSLIRSALEEHNHEIVGEADNGATAIEMALEKQPDLITLDNILPDMMGLEILKILKEEELGAKVIMISAVGQQTVVNKGLQLGAMEYIRKPFTAEDLIAAVNKVL